jgi:hypothetical protein
MIGIFGVMRSNVLLEITEFATCGGAEVDTEKLIGVAVGLVLKNRRSKRAELLFVSLVGVPANISYHFGACCENVVC